MRCLVQRVPAFLLATLLLLAVQQAHAGTVNSAYFDLIIQDNPKFYWPLNETVGATTAKNYGSEGGADGTLVRSTFSDMQDGPMGERSVYNNSKADNHHIELPRHIKPVLSPNVDVSFSIDIWVRLTESGNRDWRCPFNAHGGFSQNATRAGWNLYRSCSTPGPVSCYDVANPELMDTWQFWMGCGGSWCSVIQPISPTDRKRVYHEWQHIVGVYYAPTQTQSFYVDGEFVGSRTSAYLPDQNVADKYPYIGTIVDSVFTWDGQIAHAAFYHKALTAADVAKRWSFKDALFVDLAVDATIVEAAIYGVPLTLQERGPRQLISAVAPRTGLVGEHVLSVHVRYADSASSAGLLYRVSAPGSGRTIAASAAGPALSYSKTEPCTDCGEDAFDWTLVARVSGGVQINDAAYRNGLNDASSNDYVRPCADFNALGNDLPRGHGERLHGLLPTGLALKGQPPDFLRPRDTIPNDRPPVEQLYRPHFVRARSSLHAQHSLGWLRGQLAKR